ncbi:MAG: AsmA family protein [Planctomycetota bacterium]|jgi:hypothetical protein
MRKLSVKIAIILFAILITIIAAMSTLVFLVNSGKLTHFIERQIKTNANFDIKIKDIHLDFFSALQLKQISVTWFSGQEQFTLGCNAITIRYKPFYLLKRRIKSIDLSDIKIILNAEKKKTINSPSSQDYEISSFNIKDFYPGHLIIEDISINNTSVKITTGGYAFTLTEMDMQVKKIQMEKPLDISIQGNFSVSSIQNSQSNLSGEISINTKYSLPDDELIIMDSSCFLINGSEKFSINGKACSLLSSPEIKCNIRGKSLLEAFNSMIPENYKNWSLNGAISMDIVIDYVGKDRSQKMTAVTDLSLSKLGFASPDYDYFAEDINGQIKIKISE